MNSSSIFLNMNRYKYALLLLPFLCFILIGCDPTYTIDYEVQNATSGQISIDFSKRVENGLNLNVTSPKTTILVHEEFNIGTTSESEIMNDNMLPFDTLIIKNPQGNSLNFNSLDISNWNVSFNEELDHGIVKLRVFDASFE